MQHAFNLRSAEMLAFVGGGGKTSLMFVLANGLPGRVVTTTTTRIFAAQMKRSPVCLATGGFEKEENHSTTMTAFSNSALTAALDRFGQCLVVGRIGSGKDREKALGVAPELPGQFWARPDVDFVLVEADGSRMRPIKAPAAHEPVIPPETTVVVPMVGLDAMGGRIEDVAHRPELLSAVIGKNYSPDDRLTAADAAALLVHEQGGLKNVPEGARVIPFLNKAETAERLAAARQIAQLTLHESRITQVVLGATWLAQPVVEVHKRVTAVVLAAGQAKRMGQTKQLLPWGETTVLGQVLRNVGDTAVYNALVVSGHEAAIIETIAAEAGAGTVFNPDYVSGEMLSSLQTAVRHLPDHVAAILVVLADQPMVEPEIINQLLEAYWQRKSGLIAPSYQGKRGNPVLIDRAYFDELLALPPDAAPRHLLRRHAGALHLVPVTSDSILRDLDHPGEYEQWRPS